MIFHTLNAAPNTTAFTQCLRLLRADDALLMMGDGIYAALAGTAASEALTNSGAQLYVLKSDAAAAGIIKRLCNSVKPADYDQFVSLTEHYTKRQAWY